MKRSGFRRKELQRTKSTPTPAPKGLAERVWNGAAELRVMPKSQQARSEEYRRLVAAMPCALCGAVGISQAAHPNTGKGAGTKADDRECFPLCADQPMRRGCHSLFDQGALFTKAVRREFEATEGAKTRAAVIAAGRWPDGLAMMDEA